MAEWSLRRRRGLALIIGIPVLLVVSFWALTYTPVFRARHIRVEGAGALTVNDVRTLAGVADSTNVVHLDRDTVVHNLEASPWVADASVRVELPDTVVLVVTERRPVGVIDAMGERGDPRERRNRAAAGRRGPRGVTDRPRGARGAGRGPATSGGLTLGGIGSRRG